jgi:hypothetical protein
MTATAIDETEFHRHQREERARLEWSTILALGCRASDELLEQALRERRAEPERRYEYRAPLPGMCAASSVRIIIGERDWLSLHRWRHCAIRSQDSTENRPEGENFAQKPMRCLCRS